MAGIRLEETAIPGLLVIRPHVMRDARGSFAKTFVAEVFAEAGLATRFSEEYYTSSLCGVLRGMHFQLPPNDHDKTVSCVNGEVFDVVLDLRTGSPAFGTVAAFELSGADANSLYIPAGCAHGFCATSDDAVLAYGVTSAYSSDDDAGVLWSSIPVDWPCSNPVVSERDASLPTLVDFASPFTFTRSGR